MSTITLELIQQLRERTGAGMMDCKKALQETNGDIEKAIEVLRRRGAAVAEKRAGQATAEGIVHAYIHPGARVGVLIEVNCETDFVARTQEFKDFANNLCMQIAAFNPKYIAPADVDKAFLDKERAIQAEELKASKKPEAVINQIVEGKLNKLYTSICLIKQPYIKNDKITVEDVLKELIGKLGENIKIRRFSRFEIGG
jgi:elongation factor Ts